MIDEYVIDGARLHKVGQNGPCITAHDAEIWSAPEKDALAEANLEMKGIPEAAKAEKQEEQSS